MAHPDFPGDEVIITETRHELYVPFFSVCLSKAKIESENEELLQQMINDIENEE